MTLPLDCPFNLNTPKNTQKTHTPQSTSRNHGPWHCVHAVTSAISSSVPQPPGNATKPSDNDAIKAFLELMPDIQSSPLKGGSGSSTKQKMENHHLLWLKLHVNLYNLPTEITKISPENWWLEDDSFPFKKRFPTFLKNSGDFRVIYLVWASRGHWRSKARRYLEPKMTSCFFMGKGLQK